MQRFWKNKKSRRYFSPFEELVKIDSSRSRENQFQNFPRALIVQENHW
jgi:hypothetical protein